jgi:hypothetical protein
VGHGVLALQRGSHRPSTQASPGTRHWDVSEQRSTCAAHCPSTHRAPLDVQSESALHGMLTGAASASPAASVLTEPSVGEASSPVDASLPASPEGVASVLASYTGGVPAVTHDA